MIVGSVKCACYEKHATNFVWHCFLKSAAHDLSSLFDCGGKEGGKIFGAHQIAANQGARCREQSAFCHSKCDAFAISWPFFKALMRDGGHRAPKVRHLSNRVCDRPANQVGDRSDKAMCNWLNKSLCHITFNFVQWKMQRVVVHRFSKLAACVKDFDASRSASARHKITIILCCQHYCTTTASATAANLRGVFCNATLSV